MRGPIFIVSILSSYYAFSDIKLVVNVSCGSSLALLFMHDPFHLGRDARNSTMGQILVTALTR